jgi:hypothetical protein
VVQKLYDTDRKAILNFMNWYLHEVFVRQHVLNTCSAATEPVLSLSDMVQLPTLLIIVRVVVTEYRAENCGLFFRQI